LGSTNTFWYNDDQNTLLSTIAGMGERDRSEAV
jgi:hypothetical protein